MALVPGTEPVKLTCDFAAYRHERWINATCISSEGQICASAGADRVMNVFLSQGSERQKKIEFDERPRSGAIYDVSLAGNAIASADATGTVQVRLLLGSRRLLYERQTEGEKAWGSKLTSRGRLLAWCIGTAVGVTTVTTGEDLHTHDSKHGVACIAVTADAATLFMLKKRADKEHAFFIDVWDTKKNTIASTLFDIVAKYWPAIATDDDGERLAIADDDSLRLLTHRESKIVELPGYVTPARVNACAITRNGERVVAAINNGDFAVWDCNKRVRIATLRCKLSDGLYGSSSCGIADDGATIVAGCPDNCVRVWTMEPTEQTNLEKRARKRFQGAARGQRTSNFVLSVAEAKIELNAFLECSEGLAAVDEAELEDVFFSVSKVDAEQVSEDVFVRMFRVVFRQQRKAFAKAMWTIEQQKRGRLVAEMLTEHAERFRNRAKPRNVLSFRMAVRIIDNLRKEMWERSNSQPQARLYEGSVAEELKLLDEEGKGTFDEDAFIAAVKKLVYDVQI